MFIYEFLTGFHEVYRGELNFESWDSSADIATGYGLDGSGSIFGRSK
jgi:hypothetical protein